VGVSGLCLALLLAGPATPPPDPFRAPPVTGTPAERFAAANDLARRGDLPRAIATYGALLGEGHETAALDWNWAQAARARGAWGEALWALLRARELDPGDAAVRREIEEVREAANLDPAEIAPEPLAGARLLARRYHLGAAAAALALLSLVGHLLARLRPVARWPVRLAWVTGLLALLAGVLPMAGAAARPTAVVVERGASLLQSASPQAEPLGALREGEVLPVLAVSGSYLRVQDSSGASGWAHVEAVRRLDGLPSVRP
jgi:hypothetical protein